MSEIILNKMYFKQIICCIILFKTQWVHCKISSHFYLYIVVDKYIIYLTTTVPKRGNYINAITIPVRNQVDVNDSLRIVLSFETKRKNKIT